jgi:glycosyltransferase involved in cell wall biosynthesis
MNHCRRRLNDTLVSIGLPVRNGVQTLPNVVESVLQQDHERLELVICDNASTDGTDELCRELTRADARVVYHRQRTNVGIVNNFNAAIRMARGTFFRWVGDDDWLAPTYLSRCLEVFANDSRLLLVTTEIKYTHSDGGTRSYSYSGMALNSDNPVERLAELLRLLVEGMFLDPLYGLMRREPILTIPRRNMIREDEVFAAKLALRGPWSHVPEVLAHRNVSHVRLPVLARRLGVPAWQAYLSTVVECREMLRAIADVQMTLTQRQRARSLVLRMYVGRQYRQFTHYANRLKKLTATRVGPT